MRNGPHYRSWSRISISGGSGCADRFLVDVPFTLQWPPIATGRISVFAESRVIRLGRAPRHMAGVRPYLSHQNLGLEPPGLQLRWRDAELARQHTAMRRTRLRQPGNRLFPCIPAKIAASSALSSRPSRSVYNSPTKRVSGEPGAIQYLVPPHLGFRATQRQLAPLQAAVWPDSRARTCATQPVRTVPINPSSQRWHPAISSQVTS